MKSEETIRQQIFQLENKVEAINEQLREGGLIPPTETALRIERDNAEAYISTLEWVLGE